MSTVYIPQSYQPTGFNVKKKADHRPAKTGFLCIIYIWVALWGSFVSSVFKPMLGRFQTSQVQLDASHAAAHIYMHLNITPLLCSAPNHLNTSNRH